MVTKSFTIDGEQRLPDLVAKGYKRLEVLQLFEELENNKLGVYIRGTRGKGKCSKFIPGKFCPKTYSIQVSEAFIPKKVEQSVDPIVEVNIDIVADTDNVPKAPKKNSKNTAPVVVNSNDSTAKSLAQQTLHAFWDLSKNFIEDNGSIYIGYKCDVFNDSILVLHRVRGGGKDSIESAVKELWNDIKHKVVLKKDKSESSRLEQVVSNLRGAGIYVMNRCECKECA